MESSSKPLLWIVGGIIAVIVILWLMPFTVVDAGERAVVLRWGTVARTLDSGVHWVTPIAESVVTFDTRVQKEQVEASAASKDLQSVNTTIALNYQLVGDKIGQLYTSFNKDAKSRIIDPSIQEAVKAATAKYTAEELITKRELVRGDMIDALKAKLEPENIHVVDVSIVNFEFSAQFAASIEAKVKAVQDALKAENDLKRVQFEAQQQVATAQATAQAIRLQSDAANNEKYIQLKQLEVQKAFADKWNGVLPVNLYGSAPIPFLQLGGQK